jgi:hypothetical protein
MSASFTKGHALIIGIANYPHVSKLPETVLKDAQDVADLLRSESYCGYVPTHIKLLCDAQATVDSIRQGLSHLAQATGPHDTAIIFFSGHGGRVESGPDTGTYLLPFDCDPTRLRETAISSEQLTTKLASIQAQRLVVLLDACHAGGVGELKALDPVHAMKAGFDEKTYSALAQGIGRVVMASSRANEPSRILNGMSNSLFTDSLLEALRGAAPTHGDGFVRVFDVFHYVSDEVPTKAPQHPIFKAQDLENNFPLALHLGGKQPTIPAVSQVSQAHQLFLSGPTQLELSRRLVTRWHDLALYLNISPAELATFEKGREPVHILWWLEQRNRLHHLRTAFNFLGWDDLIEVTDRPQEPRRP